MAQSSTPIIRIEKLSKKYGESDLTALREIELDIFRGEILALLGPNGAGKSTLINIICGVVNATTGRISVDGFDIVKNYREARSLIGYVPQEITGDVFETVWNSVSFSRGLFGKKKDAALLEKILRSLSLWEKRDQKMRALSGG